MTHWIKSAGPRTISQIFAALAVAVLGLAAVPAVMAQSPPAKPKPKPQAQQPAPAPAPAPQAQQPAPQQSDVPQLIYSPWVKLCNKDPDPNAKRICVIVKDGRIESGLLVVSVAIIEMDGEARKLMRVSLPYGVQLQVGTRMIVDQGTPATAPYVTCLPPVVPPGGCIADYEATPDVLARMKKGQVLTVQAIHMNNQPMSPQLDLRDFAKAYDGPPTDPKVYEEQMKKMHEELQKKADDLRKRMEQQQPPAAPTR